MNKGSDTVVSSINKRYQYMKLTYVVAVYFLVAAGRDLSVGTIGQLLGVVRLAGCSQWK